jgi:hypothetical protein
MAATGALLNFKSAVRAAFSVPRPSPGTLRHFTEAVGCADYAAVLATVA